MQNTVITFHMMSKMRKRSMILLEYKQKAHKILSNVMYLLTSKRPMANFDEQLFIVCDILYNNREK
ncbi:hypothetical protein NE620_14555 [Longicatena caecimuris]|nr:hypothetical protein [Longicatena caecimuris]